MKFCFGDIVIVENYLIGVICKSWIKNNKEIYYEVYVRNYNCIKEFITLLTVRRQSFIFV